MNKTELKILLGNHGGRRGWRCPDVSVLAGFADNQLPERTQQSLQHHLASCDWCLSQMAFLVQSEDLTTGQPIPPALLAKARGLVDAPNSGGSHLGLWGWRWTAVAATAALLLVGGFFLFWLQRSINSGRPENELVASNEPASRPSISAVAPAGPESPTPAQAADANAAKHPGRREAPIQRDNVVRKGEIAEPSGPTIILPAERARVKTHGLTVRWMPASDAIFYELSLMTDEGDLVLNSTTDGTELKPQVDLKPGGKYFLQVSAHLKNGKTVKAKMVSFTVSR